MASRSLTFLTGLKLPQIRQPRLHDEPTPINERAVVYFARILERVNILKPDYRRDERRQD
jgi:hypothetical protein